jgi:hypothetical protein
MTAPKRRGRPPSIWRSPIGYKFVEAVAHAIYRHTGTTGMAIKTVLKQPDLQSCENTRRVRPVICRNS